MTTMSLDFVPYTCYNGAIIGASKMDAFAFALFTIGIALMIIMAIAGQTTVAILFASFLLLALAASGTRK